LTAKEIESGGAPDAWVHGAKLGYPLLRAAGEELAREGVHFIDLSLAFADQHGDIYYDCCHFDKPGHVILAASSRKRSLSASRVTARQVTTRRLRVSAGAAVLLLAAAAVLEIGARLYLRLRGHPLDAESRRAWVASVREEMTNHAEVAGDLAERREARPATAPLPRALRRWSDAKTKRGGSTTEATRRDSKAAFDVLLLGGRAASDLAARPGFADRRVGVQRARAAPPRLRAGGLRPQSMSLLASSSPSVTSPISSSPSTAATRRGSARATPRQARTLLPPSSTGARRAACGRTGISSGRSTRSSARDEA
jgi:hypothetical protein